MWFSRQQTLKQKDSGQIQEQETWKLNFVSNVIMIFDRFSPKLFVTHALTMIASHAKNLNLVGINVVLHKRHDAL